VASKILAKYSAKLRFFQAEDGLQLALAALPEFDFDTLVAAHNEGKAMGLEGELMNEAGRLLNMPGKLQRSFEDRITPEDAGGAVGQVEWHDNPQYRVILVGERPQKLTVSLTVKDVHHPAHPGETVEASYALHVLMMEPQESKQAARSAAILEATEYDASSKILSFDMLPGQAYFLVPSLAEKGLVARYELTVHQPCQRATGDLLCAVSKVDLVQTQLASLAGELRPAYGPLSSQVTFARQACVALLKRAADLGLEHSERVQAAQARTLQLDAVVRAEAAKDAGDAEKLRKCISISRQCRVPPPVVRRYHADLLRLTMEADLQQAVAMVEAAGEGPPAEVHARLRGLLDECAAVAFQGPAADAAAEALEALSHQSVAGQFSMAEDSAAGRMELCQWRSNPQMHLDLQGEGPLEVAISLVRYAQDAPEEDTAEEDPKEYDSFALHVVRNTGEWPLGGVGVDFEVVAYTDYTSESKALALTLDPSQGPYYLVPSALEDGEEGGFTASVLTRAADADKAHTELVTPMKARCRMVTGFSKDLGGAYAKNGVNVKDKKFKVGKTWLQNPQFRVHLNWDHDKDKPINPEGLPAGELVTEATLTVVVATAIDEAQLGIHLMRNKQCQIGNLDEHSHCLAQRYHTMVDRTPTYVRKSEIYTNFVLNIHETVGDKGGALVDFPFFVIPSLYEKAEGKVYVTFYSDQNIGIELIDPEAVRAAFDQ